MFILFGTFVVGLCLGFLEIFLKVSFMLVSWILQAIIYLSFMLIFLVYKLLGLLCFKLSQHFSRLHS